MKQTSKSQNGSSYHGTCVTTSVEVMKRIAGLPFEENNCGEDKVNMEWVLETDDGDVFTIYDWKEYRPLNLHDVITWHIGGHSKTITEKALSEINKELFK